MIDPVTAQEIPRDLLPAAPLPTPIERSNDCDDCRPNSMAAALEAGRDQVSISTDALALADMARIAAAAAAADRSADEGLAPGTPPDATSGTPDATSGAPGETPGAPGEASRAGGDALISASRVAGLYSASASAAGGLDSAPVAAAEPARFGITA